MGAVGRKYVTHLREQAYVLKNCQTLDGSEPERLPAFGQRSDKCPPSLCVGFRVAARQTARPPRRERAGPSYCERAPGLLRPDSEAGQEGQIVGLVDAVLVVGTGAVGADAEGGHDHHHVGVVEERRAAGVTEAGAALVY